MAAYESVVDGIQARLTVARKAVKDTYTDKDKKKDGGGMYDSYTSAMAEIKLLEKRLRVAKAKVPKRDKKTKRSDSERARQGLPPKKVAKSLEKKAKAKKNEKKKTPSPKTEKKDTGETKGTPFGGKKFGGKKFGGKRFGGKKFGGKEFGGKEFGGSEFGGAEFGGRRFGASDDPYKSEAERKKALKAKNDAEKDAQILKDIRKAEKEVKAEAKVARQIAQDRPAASSIGGPSQKVKVPASIAGRTDKMVASGKDEKLPEDISWKKGHDPVTKFMEELLGTKRTVAQVKKDMAADKKIEEELKDEMLEFYGKKRGGKVTAKRPSAKKYAMNRGGKVASLRKPTRA